MAVANATEQPSIWGWISFCALGGKFQLRVCWLQTVLCGGRALGEENCAPPGSQKVERIREGQGERHLSKAHPW